MKREHIVALVLALAVLAWLVHRFAAQIGGAIGGALGRGIASGSRPSTPLPSAAPPTAERPALAPIRVPTDLALAPEPETVRVPTSRLPTLSLL